MMWRKYPVRAAQAVRTAVYVLQVAWELRDSQYKTILLFQAIRTDSPEQFEAAWAYACEMAPGGVEEIR